MQVTPTGQRRAFAIWGGFFPSDASDVRCWKKGFEQELGAGDGITLFI